MKHFVIICIVACIFIAGCITQEQPALLETPFKTPTLITPSKTPEPSLVFEERGDYEVKIQSAGVQRMFMAHLPDGYQPGSTYPLVIALHGRGGTANDMTLMTSFSLKADQEGFIVIYPQAIWNDLTWMIISGDEGSLEDMAFLWDVINYAIENLSADAQRVYAVGFSNGGGMAHRLGCALAEKLAGIATVSGSYPVHQNCHPTASLPVLAFHGTADTFVPYDGDSIQPSILEWAEAWAERNGCQSGQQVIFEESVLRGDSWDECDADAAVVLYTIEGGELFWPGGVGQGGINATDMIWEFFQAHEK